MKPEAKIEKAVSSWAKAQGILNFKFVSPAHRGVPDRIFLAKDKVCFIEFKAPTGKLSALQVNTILALEKAGANVFTAFSEEAGIACLKKFFRL